MMLLDTISIARSMSNSRSNAKTGENRLIAKLSFEIVPKFT